MLGLGAQRTKAPKTKGLDSPYQGLGFRVWGLGFGVWGLGFRV